MVRKREEMKMRKKYITPEAEIEKFTIKNVISTSPNPDEGIDDGGNDGGDLGGDVDGGMSDFEF